MVSGNFGPLKRRWPQLFEHARLAENYVNSDPHTAIIKLRCFAETLVSILYRELNLPSNPTDSFFERLKSQAFEDIVDKAVIQKLHAIRVLGNRAAHGSGVSARDALALLKEAYLISLWLYHTYSGRVADEYPPYEEPLNGSPNGEPTLGQSELARQLAIAKAELAELEKRLQLTANKQAPTPDQAKLQKFKDSATHAASTIDFQVENTRRLINIHDAFAEYTLNAGQAELVNRLGQFLTDNEQSVFILKGYAGTGKTFITKGLTEYFRAIGRNFVLAAPTGKASKVIAEKVKSPAFTIHKTIYSFIDMKEYRQDDKDGTQTYKFYASLNVNDRSVDTVFIVDEASMISDIYQESEFFRCGSGFLLRDFFDFVNLDHNDHRKKVILIGDDAQLPPVGMKFSPALDANYLYLNYNVRSICHELTEVVRQKAESGVMRNSIKLRESLATGVFNQLVIDLDYPDIAKVEHTDLLARYLESCGGKINRESIIIAPSNADVADYNRLIRASLFPNCTEVTSGDKVIAVSNSSSYGFFISNGDFGQIKNVLGMTERHTVTLRRNKPNVGEAEEIPVTLAFRDLLVVFKDLEGKPCSFEAKILENLLYNDQPGLSSDESKALYVHFCIRNRSLKPGSLEFKSALMSDPYFNALRMKFGYAITCHKAQGSEWNHVFVKCKSHHNQLSADYFRWLYTAITRTTKKLYLLDPPNHKLGGAIRMVRSPGFGMPSRIESQVTCPLDAAHTLPVTAQPLAVSVEPTLTFGIPANAPFLLAILAQVRKLISGKNIEVNDITHNQYQETYSFSRGSDFARLNIAYNTKPRVTGITSLQITALGGELITLLDSLRRIRLVSAPELNQLQFGQKFLNDFHQRLTALSEQQGITIQNVVEQQWCQRYSFVRGGELAVYDVWYNAKSSFTKCQPVKVDCSPGTLVDDVGRLLTEGMNS